MAKAKKTKKVAHGEKQRLVWDYLLENKTARPSEVARATGVSYGYVHKLMSKIGTPREVFEAEEAAKSSSTELPGKLPTTAKSVSRSVFVGAALICVVLAWVLYAR